jgi:hypothetical protein
VTPTGEHSQRLTSASPQPEHPDTASPAPARLRNAFTITSRRSADGHEHHLITAPKHGPDRSQARRAIMAVLHDAEQRHHRVAFLVTLGDYTQQLLNPPRGYDADLIFAQCRIEHDDPYSWLQRQFRPTSPTPDTNAIIGVTIHTWPPTTQPGQGSVS